MDCASGGLQLWTSKAEGYGGGYGEVWGAYLWVVHWWALHSVNGLVSSEGGCASDTLKGDITACSGVDSHTMLWIFIPHQPKGMGKALSQSQAVCMSVSSPLGWVVLLKILGDVRTLAKVRRCRHAGAPQRENSERIRSGVYIIVDLAIWIMENGCMWGLQSPINLYGSLCAGMPAESDFPEKDLKSARHSRMANRSKKKGRLPLTQAKSWLT